MLDRLRRWVPGNPRRWLSRGFLACLLVLLSFAWYSRDALQATASDLWRDTWSAPMWRVREVVVRGAFLTPRNQILEALSISHGRSIWHDWDAAQARLVALPSIENARVQRRLPGTVVVSLREAPLLARLATEHGGLGVVRTGEVLSSAPPSANLDSLPWIDAADVEDREVLLESWDLLLRSGVSWTSWVDTLRPVEHGYAAAWGGDAPYPGAEVWLPYGRPGATTRWLSPVLRNAAPSPAGAPVVVDLRFQGVVLVQAPSDSSSSR